MRHVLDYLVLVPGTIGRKRFGDLTREDLQAIAESWDDIKRAFEEKTCKSR